MDREEKIEVLDIRAADTYPLRSKVLRPGQPPEANHYPRDAEGVHFGLFLGKELRSVVTAHPEDHPAFPGQGQWRIRGMATEEGFRGRGLGKLLLSALLAWGARKGLPLFWCNARESAISFYER
jgi:GNAT superfamily N-acetyltransferase